MLKCHKLQPLYLQELHCGISLPMSSYITIFSRVFQFKRIQVCDDEIEIGHVSTRLWHVLQVNLHECQTIILLETFNIISEKKSAYQKTATSVPSHQYESLNSSIHAPC